MAAFAAQRCRAAQADSCTAANGCECMQDWEIACCGFTGHEFKDMWLTCCLPMPTAGDIVERLQLTLRRPYSTPARRRAVASERGEGRDEQRGTLELHRTPIPPLLTSTPPR
mmetsp:Transcript_41540/g.95182  ORF Transcript_41540/g.95182 Transcript_41540/m.95182 type:complete len:112 (+) Transcript_41540:459-794(+)